MSKKRGIVQRYVPNPMLIGQRKFDMRIYVVVLSYDPLKVYINEEGLVRFATEAFSDSVDTLASRMMHLTNYSVNKQNPLFVQNSDGQGDDVLEDAAVDEKGVPKASKWSLKELRKHFARTGVDYDEMWEGIKDVVIKTLIAVEEPMKAEWVKNLEEEDQGWAARGPGSAHRQTCFELYGFDILVDDQLKSWLLEVNICPSLSSGSPLDKRIKTKLVADIVTLVGVHPPVSLWGLWPESVNWKGKSRAPDSIEDEEGEFPCTLSAAEQAKKARKLAQYDSPADALANFDKIAWELVLEAHEEEFRSGGLERIFPCKNAAEYTRFLPQESYPMLVLRKWYEAGGPELFIKGSKLIPPWVPRQVCHDRT
eukprot:TRINITY_DN114195_c0_g1_i1.p1 TRINITY_DN114195_c0_g1~~TRINITY_DN114195_c0_g1_i1.p1  ORF type:complete len:376 (+),score=92.17 TRINITY_DN114195_c0_g1_i1:30-1130(+)